MCDGGDRYAGNYYNPAWLAAQGLDPEPHEDTIRGVLRDRASGPA